MTPISVVTATVGTLDGSMVRVGAITGFLVMVAVALRGVVESTYNDAISGLGTSLGRDILLSAILWSPSIKNS